MLAFACQSAPAVARAGALEVRDAYAFEPVLGDVASTYFSIRNTGTAPDSLSGVTSEQARSVMMHRQVDDDGQAIMRHLETVEIAAGATVTFAPGGTHLMLEQLTALVTAGDTLDLMLHFNRAGDVVVRAPVRPYGSSE